MQKNGVLAEENAARRPKTPYPRIKRARPRKKRERPFTFRPAVRPTIHTPQLRARDPSIVLLDEPTNSLDVEGEVAVQAAIARLVEGRTTLLIAHRPTASLQLLHDRLSIVAGPSLVLSAHSPELVGRAGAAFGF